MKKFIALLPMKAHSERIEGKNFKLFKGKPLFQWILESLISNEDIKEIVINTDNIEIFRQYEIIKHPKVLLRSRPEEIQGDFVSMNKIIEYDLERFNESDTHFIMTHSTNPLISSATIFSAIQTYNKALNNDSLVTVNKFQSRFYSKDFEAINHDPRNLIRTQDLDPLFEENSCLYIFSRASFNSTKARIGDKPYLFVTPPLESVDIDDSKSWNQAEMNFETIRKNEI